MQARQYDILVKYQETNEDILQCLRGHERQASGSLALNVCPASASRIDVQLLQDAVRMNNSNLKILELRVMASDAYGNYLPGAMHADASTLAKVGLFPIAMWVLYLCCRFRLKCVLWQSSN